MLRVTLGKNTKGNQRRLEIGLGGYPTVTLQQAQSKAREMREKFRQGIDPRAERKAARNALIASQARGITFKEATHRCIEAKASAWKNAKHRQQWENTLDRYAFPTIGDIQIKDIDTPHVLQVLEPIWKDITETATRLRGRIETIIDWATACKYRNDQMPNPARWKGHLSMMLPNPKKIADEGKHPALPYSEISQFMKHLRKIDGIGALALEFTILTAARSGEVRGASWNEIDLKTKVWSIPAERMKMGQAHEVPLTDELVTLLKKLPRHNSTNLVFPSPKTLKELSDATLAKVIKRMHESEIKAGRKGYIDPKQNDKNGNPKIATPHGFRSTFRDWAAEETNHSRDAAKMALAHGIEDSTEAHYRRGDLLKKRRALMKDWDDATRADYLDEIKGGN